VKGILFDYPKQAYFGRVLPKNKIYEHGTPSPGIKDLFVRQVEQIVWQYKLAPETINLPQTKSVPEIQVFRIVLKNGELKKDVLRCIDQAIPFPLVFEIAFDGKLKFMATYKHPSNTEQGNWLLSDYYETDWISQEALRTPLPIVLDLGALYEQLLSSLLLVPALPLESLPQRVERIGLIRAKEREIEKCDARLRKEKQFNHKVEINAELRTLTQELESLTRSGAVVSV